LPLQRKLVALCVLLMASACFLLAQQSRQSAGELVVQALRNESEYRMTSEHFAYTSREQSTRTGGHLWIEKVVVTELGVLRKLISIDGQPLSAEKARAEEQRIERFATHPDEFIQANRERESDGKMKEKIMRSIGAAFLFAYDGEADGCSRIRFQPNPSFTPSTYQDRVLQALEGTILVKEPDRRVCGLDARVARPVEIGFGVLGKLERGGMMHVSRVQTASGTWENAVLDVHIVGRMLIVKSLSQELDQMRSDIRDIPAHLNVAQAADLLEQ
jgi:hypothetical protein